ncbi:uncharacterized protein J7T54_005065, partial [Emericellopsis cladophorae]
MFRPAHPGTVLENDTKFLITICILYKTTFVDMDKKGSVESWYIIAINHLSKEVKLGIGGWLGPGELPPVENTDDWAVAPTEFIDDSWRSSSTYTTNTTKVQVVVDSGNDMNLMPPGIAESVDVVIDRLSAKADFGQQNMYKYKT